MGNDEQIRVWNEINAERWIRLRKTTVRSLLPFGEAALAALRPEPGESALDVGCGFGDTTLMLAQRTGTALGIDVCEPFLRIAREEAAFGARYLLADAQTHAFAEKFDLCFSRFGVMFFEDPVAAFRNLRSALHPAGRFAAAVWGPFRDNEWARVPFSIARRHLPAQEPGNGPGPFSLGDSVERVLGEAGFSRMAVLRLEIPFDAEAAQLMEQGPAAALLRTAAAPADLRALVAKELEDAMGGRKLSATALVVTATAAG
jgi:SAM-dependent methyltransferase